MINALFWLLVILVSAAAAIAVTLPLRVRMRAIESLLDMIVKVEGGKLKIQKEEGREDEG